MDSTEWHEIGDKLTNYFGICSCQRKIKLIIDNLFSIKEKCSKGDYDFTGAEWLLLAIMESNNKLISHGINCEYPIVDTEDPFWLWIDEVKNNKNLKDN